MANVAMAVGAGPTGTMRLYESFWRNKESKIPMAAAIARSLKALAEVHNRTVTPTLLASYIAPLENLSEEEIVLAFSRAHDEEDFWPPPSRLRGLSGRAATGDPLEREASAELRKVIAAMRKFGPFLKPKMGEITSTDTPEGRLRAEPLRGPTEMPPAFSDRTQAAIFTLGWDDQRKGLSILSDHPALRAEGFNKGDAGEFRKNILREADELERRWLVAYRAARR